MLVAIDDKTFNRDEYGKGFPFSRNFHADVIEQVSKGEPRVIVYDVQFTEPSDDRRADNRLFLAAQQAGNVVFSTTETLPGRHLERLRRRRRPSRTRASPSATGSSTRTRAA